VQELVGQNKNEIEVVLLVEKNKRVYQGIKKIKPRPLSLLIYQSTAGQPRLYVVYSILCCI
jgi:hypothetical protein